MRKWIIMILVILMASLLTAETMTINLNNGESVEFNIEEIEQITFDSDASVEEIAEFISQIPIKFLKNYPNPFNPTTTISFEIKEAGNIKVEIFNMKGQKIKTLLDERINSGKHSVIWNGKNNKNKRVSSGMYFYKVSINGNQKINKMIMLK